MSEPLAAPRTESDRRSIWILIAGLLLLRVLYAAVFPLELAPDESYYWDWGRRPDLGYFSKPPMIGWLMGIAGAVGNDSMFVLKLFPGLLTTGGLVFVYLLGRDLFGVRTGFLAVVLLAATPANVALNTFFTIDAPLFLFSSASLWLAWKWYVSPSSGRAWAAGLALAMGLGYLTKQIHLLFPACLGAFLLVRKSNREGRWRWGVLAVAVLASLAMFAPPVWWNSQHEWITVRHTTDELAREFSWRRSLSFLGDFAGGQAGLGGGITWILMVAAVIGVLRNWQAADDRYRFLALFSAPGLAMFVGLSLYQKVEQNWPLVFYVPAVVLAAAAFRAEGAARRWSEAWMRRAVVLGGSLGVLLMFVPFVVPRSAWAGARIDATARLRGWREMVQKVDGFRQPLKVGGEVVLIAPDDRYIASALAYYLPDHPRTWCWEYPGKPVSQYGIWGRPLLKEGVAYLVVTARPDSEPSQDLARRFRTWRELGEIHVRSGNGRVAARDRAYRVFLGSGILPVDVHAGAGSGGFVYPVAIQEGTNKRIDRTGWIFRLVGAGSRIANLGLSL